jgi:hypothetical protein
MRIAVWSEEVCREFEDSVRRWGDPLAYEQNWVYLAQCCRRGGWVCSDSYGWVAVAKDYLGVGRHAAVVPLSADMVDFLPSAMRFLQGEGIRPEVVKHVPVQYADMLSNQGFAIRRHPTEYELSTVCLEELSEDRCPQVLINIGYISWIKDESDCAQWLDCVPDGPLFGDFRYQLRRFCRKYLRNGVEVTEAPVTQSTLDVTNQALHNWLESVKIRFSQAGRPKVVDFNACFREPVEALLEFALQHPNDVIGSVISVGSRPSSIWLGSRISEVCFGVYILLADTRVRNLADFTLYRALCNASMLGFQWVNLGGSELRSLYHFKAKLSRIKSEHIYTTRHVLDLEWRGI